MSTTKKPLGESELKGLPAERQATIADFAVAHTLAETVDWLRADGVRTCSAALSAFLSWYHLKQQLVRNEAIVQMLLAELGKPGQKLTARRLQEAGQAFFTALALAQQDPRAWYLTQQIALRRAQVELAWQKYRDQVAERKAALEREVKAAQADGGLSPETLEKIERELNLL